MTWTGKDGVHRTLAVLLLLGLCAAGGCLSRSVQKQRYAIDLQRPEGKSGPGKGVLRVAIVRAAPAFERKSFVYRRGENTYVSDFYNEFYSEPGVMLRENLIAWIEQSGIFEYVVAASDTEPDWILESRLETLYGDGRGEEAAATLASLKFTLLDARVARRPIVFQESYQARAELEGKGHDQYVGGVKAALVEIFGSLEQDLRVVVEEDAASAAAAVASEGGQ